MKRSSGWRHTLGWVVLASSMAVTSPLVAGGVKHQVSTEDIARVDPSAIETLADAEHKASMADIALTAARQAVDGGDEDLSAAKAEYKSAKAGVKAAKKESKAAEENVDADRMEAAGRSVETAETKLANAKAHYRFMKQEVKLRDAKVGLREAELGLARAQLELARLQLLISQGSPVAEKYVLADFEAQVERYTEDVAKETAKVEKRQAKVAEVTGES